MNSVVYLASFLIGVFTLSSVPTMVSAQSEDIESLLAQIATLTALVNDLTKQITAIQTGTEYETSNVFFRNLEIGDRGQDVFELQKLLNRNSVTQIADSGVGSPGNETNYFGNRTHDAVKKFQELYASEILNPAGLVTSTGFVGPSTRAKLNSFFSTPEIVKEQGEDTKDRSLDVARDDPVGSEEIPEQIVVSGFSNFYVLPGEKITIQGSGFSKSSNSVRIGEIVVENVKRNSLGFLELTIPEIDPGVYEVSVKNGKAESFTWDLVVLFEEPHTPVIENFEPKTISYGDTVTIVGKHFTQTGNVIFTDGFQIRDLASSNDGTVIRFEYILPSFKTENFPQEILDMFTEEQIRLLESADLSHSTGRASGISIAVINANGKSNVVDAVYK